LPQVFVWGNGENGQLGRGDLDFKYQDTPQLQTRLQNLMIERVGAGGCHSLVVTDSGEVWSWGTSFNGQLGLDSSNREIDTRPTLQKMVMMLSYISRYTGDFFLSFIDESKFTTQHKLQRLQFITIKYHHHDDIRIR
jgi:hypothetical protein